jgi:archaetidylinositol phosphate synthase
MASRLIDFCEQANPSVLGEVRRTKRFENAQRINNGLTSGLEKRVLIWMAERTPAWINSDHLTILGFLGQVLAGASYALALRNRYWLLAVIGFLALNWLGDSLDGTLARVRQRLRPRYGFYVDHIVDSFGGLALMGGLALSGYMQPWIAMGLLVGFLLLSIQSYLATYTLGEFQLSFWNFGPTELRLLLAVGNVALFYHPLVFHGHYRLFDVGGVIGLAGMAVMLVFFTARNTRRLYLAERITEHFQ